MGVYIRVTLGNGPTVESAQYSSWTAAHGYPQSPSNPHQILQLCARRFSSAYLFQTVLVNCGVNVFKFLTSQCPGQNRSPSPSRLSFG